MQICVSETLKMIRSERLLNNDARKIQYYLSATCDQILDLYAKMNAMRSWRQKLSDFCVQVDFA